MDINNYLIDQEGKDWNSFVADWDFVLPSSFTIWLVNRFGDIVLVLDDESVHFFDVGTGTVERVADNREHFCELIDDEDNAKNWLLINLTDACVAAGLTPGPNQCYSFKAPPILGGKYEVDNVAPTNLAVHYSFQADICRQTKNLPSGTKVRIVIGTPDGEANK